MARDDRRGAERHSPPKPVPATFGGFAVRILDVSLLGCRVEHTDRFPARAHLALRFAWRGAPVRIDASVARSELTSVGGRPAYVSGLAFCDSPEDSPPVIRDIVGWLVAAARKAEPVVVQEEEAEALSAAYLQCTFEGGRWIKLFVEDPAQPADGFTIRAPASEKEADVLCRAWLQADPARRKAMRASFERDIKR